MKPHIFGKEKLYVDGKNMGTPTGPVGNQHSREKTIRQPDENPKSFVFDKAQREEVEEVIDTYNRLGETFPEPPFFGFEPRDSQSKQEAQSQWNNLLNQYDDHDDIKRVVSGWERVIAGLKDRQSQVGQKEKAPEFEMPSEISVIKTAVNQVVEVGRSNRPIGPDGELNAVVVVAPPVFEFETSGHQSPNERFLFLKWLTLTGEVQKRRKTASDAISEWIGVIAELRAKAKEDEIAKARSRVAGVAMGNGGSGGGVQPKPGSGGYTQRIDLPSVPNPGNDLEEPRLPLGVVPTQQIPSLARPQSDKPTGEPTGFLRGLRGLGKRLKFFLGIEN